MGHSWWLGWQYRFHPTGPDLVHAQVRQGQVERPNQGSADLHRGYDTTQDNDAIPDNPKSDSSGNALYVVDADTGQKLWMAGPTGTAMPI